jgi:tetratricopeptide (TPR) repeat protein
LDTGGAAKRPLPSRPLFHPPQATLIGIGIALGLPVLLGLALWVGDRLGVSSGNEFVAIRLATAVLEIASLLALVTLGERRLPGSVGIWPPSLDDMRFGLGAAAVCSTLAIIMPAAFNSSPSAEGSFAFRWAALFPENVLALYRGSFWLVLPTLAAIAIAHELGMHGFVASRIRTLSGSVIVAGASAFALSFLASVPLFGLTYTLEVAPIEAVLIGLFLWKRRLLPCIVGNFAVGTVLFLLTIASREPAYARAKSGASKPAPVEQKAIAELNTALGGKFGAADPFVESASKEAQHGDYDQAISEMDKALAAQPKQPALWVYRGDLYSAQNRHEAAIADYGQAISLQPDAPGIYLRRANEYVKADQDIPAHRDFAKAIELSPDDPDLYIDRSVLYGREDRYEDALRDINTALKLRPANINLLLRRANALEALRRYDEAIAVCNGIIAQNSSRVEGYACRAHEEDLKGDLTAAILDLGEVLKRMPGDPGTLYDRADMEFQIRQWSAARADMVALSKTRPLEPTSEDWCAHQLATSIHPELRDGKGAVALATRACEATGWKNSTYLETLASAYAEAGDFQQAIRWAQRAIDVARTDDPASENVLRWQLTERYEKGLPFRLDDANRIVPSPSRGRMAMAVIATALALIGLVTVIVLSLRFLLRLWGAPSRRSLSAS